MFAKPKHLAMAHTYCAGLGDAVLSWNCLCASKLAQRQWCRESVFLIPTSGRTTPTKGGVVSLSGIPSSRHTPSQSREQGSALVRCCTYIVRL